jgi:hypothetical protein
VPAQFRVTGLHNRSAFCAERIFYIRHAFRAGFKIDAVYLLTNIDRWFLHNIKEIVEMEEELAKAGKLDALA